MPCICTTLPIYTSEKTSWRMSQEYDFTWFQEHLISPLVFIEVHVLTFVSPYFMSCLLDLEFWLFLLFDCLVSIFCTSLSEHLILHLVLSIIIIVFCYIVSSIENYVQFQFVYKVSFYCFYLNYLLRIYSQRNNFLTI